VTGLCLGDFVWFDVHHILLQACSYCRRDFPQGQLFWWRYPQLQHLASQRNSIYSTISTLRFQLLPCTWTLDATNMFEVLTQAQFCAFLLLFITCRCPIYQTSVDTVRGEMVPPRFSSTNAGGYTDQQTSRLYRPVSVVSHLCSNSSCPCVSNLSNLFVCNVCGFNYFSVCVYFGEPTSTL